MRKVKGAGFAKALSKRGGSLLPSGITGTDGGFKRGDSVTICGKAGTAIAMDRLGNLQLT